MDDNYVFLLRSGSDEFELVYYSQDGNCDGPVVAEAQIFVKSDHVEGGCHFFVDSVSDMDRLISELNLVRDKMVKHCADKPDISNYKIVSVGEIKPVEKLPAFPHCSQCRKILSNGNHFATSSICHDCEKKAILDKVNPPFDLEKFEKDQSDKFVSDAVNIGMDQPVGILKDKLLPQPPSVSADFKKRQYREQKYQQ